MKLNKDKWEMVPIGNLCTKVANILKSAMNGEFTYIEIGAINSSNNKIETYERVNWNVASPNAKQVVVKNDILYSTVRVNLKKIAMIDKQLYDGIATVGFCVIRSDINKVEPRYLFQVCLSDFFTNRLLLLSSGTTYPIVKNKDVFSIPIPLPPLSEQKQIAALFQSIETAMEQVEKQEKGLKKLWKSLIDAFVSDKPCFGNLLKDKTLKTYNYCDVTEKLMRKIDPLTYGIERIVAGENLESEDFKIRTWQKVGEGYLGPAFHVLFKAGDILYGSRRTYLRKVSYADFDGVCANTTYVIKANEELLLQSLLKHIMLSERFTQYSIGVSKGSTNPYINWKDLDNFTFQIPDIHTQEKIVNVLDGIWETINLLKHQKATLKNLKHQLLNEILG